MVAVPEAGPVPDEEQQMAAYAPPTTREGWQQFVGTPPPQPPPTEDEDWSLEERLDYHSRFVVLTTPVGVLAYVQRCVRMKVQRK